MESTLEKLEDGRILVAAGDHSWAAYAAGDLECPGGFEWTADPGNAIVMNSSFFPSEMADSDDPIAAAAILAGILAHEHLHCLSLVNTMSSDTGIWADPCGLYENEIYCANAEELVLLCMASCGCLTSITPAGMNDPTTRGAKLDEFREGQEDLMEQEGC